MYTGRTNKEEREYGWRKMERKWQRDEGNRIEKSQDGGWKKVGSKGWCGDLKGIRDGGGERGI
jgi:hypothetical protein